MQILVADAGPLIALAVADVLPVATRQFDLCVPQAVLDECLADPYAPGAGLILDMSGSASFTVIAENAIKPLDSAYALGLGTGEVAVLSYAQQHKHIALVDDRRARRIARLLGVPVVGSGAVLLALKASGVIKSIRPALSSWTQHSYFLSPSLHQQLLESASESI